MTTTATRNIRGRIDPPDAVLLLIGLGIVLFFASMFHRPAFIGGALLAYSGLIIALVFIPQRWMNGE